MNAKHFLTYFVVLAGVFMLAFMYEAQQVMTEGVEVYTTAVSENTSAGNYVLLSSVVVLFLLFLLIACLKHFALSPHEEAMSQELHEGNGQGYASKGV